MFNARVYSNRHYQSWSSALGLRQKTKSFSCVTDGNSPQNSIRSRHRGQSGITIILSASSSISALRRFHTSASCCSGVWFDVALLGTYSILVVLPVSIPALTGYGSISRVSIKTGSFTIICLNPSFYWM